MKNQTYNYNPTDKVCFDIPVDTDLAYQLQKRNDWQFRIYAQMLKRKSEGYSSYFFTLTYADCNLPHFTYAKNKYYNFVKKDYDKEVVTIPCFDREHIRKFVRGIQQDLLRYYNIKDIDYIICSEYGSNTKRPHYHGVFIVPNTYRQQFEDANGKRQIDGTFTQVELHVLIRKHWSKITSKRREGKKWNYTRELLGWVLPSRPNGNKALGKKPLKIADNENDLTSSAIYVSKYCTKDIAFYDRKDVLEARKALQPCKDDYQKEKYAEFRHCLPFLKCSQHFGECINEIVLGDDIPSWCPSSFVGGSPVTKCVDGIKTPLHNKGLTQIPAYNKRKLFELRVPVSQSEAREVVFQPHEMSIFDYDEDKLVPQIYKAKKITYEYEVYKTDFYRECLPALYNKLVLGKIDALNDFYLNYHDTKEFTDFLTERYRLWENTNPEWQLDFNKMVYKIKRMKNDVDSLAIYSCVYRNRVNPAHLVDYLQCPDKYDHTYYISNRVVPVVSYSYDYSHNRYSKNVVSVNQDDVYLFDGNTAPRILEDVPDFVREDFPLASDAPYFNGNECLDYMCDNAFNFYQCLGDVVRYPTCSLSAPNEISSLHFNSFPCFAGYDDVLLCIEDFLKIKSNQRLTATKAKEDAKKKVKDNFNKI